MCIVYAGNDVSRPSHKRPACDKHAATGGGALHLGTLTETRAAISWLGW